MVIEGKISIDIDKKTVTIRLDNGSYCRDLFTNGTMHFLNEEIEHRRCEKLKKEGI